MAIRPNIHFQTKFMRIFLMTALTIVAAFFYNAAFSQQKVLTGRVIDKTTLAPLYGVTVTVNGKSVLTDTSGNFSIPFSPGNTITFSYTGMLTQTMRLTGSSERMSIGMQRNDSGLDEVVVTGYQTQRKVDLTGSVAVVKLSDIQDIPNSNPIQAMQG